ncbi:MAG: PAS domain S-box protein [Desulfobacteraceae bacterium]|jgi:PAS domain S-box-containing protein
MTIEKSITSDSTVMKDPDFSKDNIKKSISHVNDIFDERYKIFLEQVSDGVFETDIFGNFIYFNKAFCNILGHSGHEIQGHDFSKFMNNENARKAYETFTNIWVTHDEISDLHWEIIDSEGKTRLIELSIFLIKDKKGTKKGFRGIARDITQRMKTINALKKSELLYEKETKASRRAELMARNLLNFIPYPMIVSDLNAKISYLNPAFTRTFGWTLDELKGEQIPFVQANLAEEAKINREYLLKKKHMRLETKRLTKDGRILDVIIRGAVYTDEENDNDGGKLFIIRDITQEKKLELTNETLLRISTALPEYPVLEDLLDYISNETKRLLNSESSTVAILDETRNEISFLGAAYDDSDAKYRIKKVRFPAENTITGRVIKSGKPVIVHDSSKEPDFYPGVDKQADIQTRNMLFVPLRSRDRTIGVLAAVNKKEGAFDYTDIELMNMIAGTVALSVENARYSEELREAYHEVTMLNRAKDKVINHLSHEIKTPVSVLLATLNILAKRLEPLPSETWETTLKRAKRNLERILDIQYEVEDIMRNNDFKSYHMLSTLLDECSDELEALVAEEFGEGNIVEKLRNKIEDVFGPKVVEIRDIDLASLIDNNLRLMEPYFSHRDIDIVKLLEKSSSVHLPQDVLEKVITGLIKNAIENTPDKGKIEISVRPKSGGTELIVKDYGVGITDEYQHRIFEGFFATQDTMNYSSKRPFDFNAGGKGADLLRTKIFSEKFNFSIDMQSTRCEYIPEESDICYGNVERCQFCSDKEDCYASGGTVFTLFFPEPSPKTV